MNCIDILKIKSKNIHNLYELSKSFSSRDEMILSDDHVNKCPHEEQLSGLYYRVSGLAPCKSSLGLDD